MSWKEMPQDQRPLEQVRSHAHRHRLHLIRKLRQAQGKLFLPWESNEHRENTSRALPCRLDRDKLNAVYLPFLPCCYHSSAVLKHGNVIDFIAQLNVDCLFSQSKSALCFITESGSSWYH